MPPVKRKKHRSKPSLPASLPASLPDRSIPVQSAAQLAPQPGSKPPAQSISPSAAQTTSQRTIDLADQLHSAAIHLLRRLRVRDRESGIGPAQLSALSVLVFSGPRSLGELADAEQVRPPTMSRIVAGLHRAKLVRRHATDDGRRVRLSATGKGTKILWAGRKRRVETLAKAVTGLPENERQHLREAVSLLQEVIRNL